MNLIRKESSLVILTGYRKSVLVHSIDWLMGLISAKINQENYLDSFMAIRFENLVGNTKTTMKNVSSFLE